MNTRISDAAVEIVAPFFYQLLPLTEGLKERPSWVERGNSLKQDEARGIARVALETALPHLQPAKPEAVRLRDELRERAEQSGVKLPPLPVSRGFIQWHAPQALHQAHGFTSTQMQDYALAALAATGKQQVGELQRDALKALVQEMDKFRTTWTTVSMREFGYFVDKMKAGLADRQPVEQAPVACRYRHRRKNGKFFPWNYADSLPSHRIEGYEYDALYAAPPAQGIDLGQFRECVELMEWQERGQANPDFPVGDPKKHAEALRLLALIDGQAVQS